VGKSLGSRPKSSTMATWDFDLRFPEAEMGESRCYFTSRQVKGKRAAARSRGYVATAIEPATV